MASINPYRMIGRIDRAVDMIMRRNSLAAVKPFPDMRTKILAVTLRVGEYDRVFCENLYNAYNYYIERAALLDMSDAEKMAQEKIGREESEYIFSNSHIDYFDNVLADKDFITAKHVAEARRRKRRKITVITILSVIGFIILFSVIYNLEYFREGRAFDKVEEAYQTGDPWNTGWHVGQYTREFPDGKHLEEVLIMNVRVQGEDRSIDVLDAIEEYLNRFPKGTYADECRQISDRIWDNEINLYKEKVGQGDDMPEGAAFMIKLLENLKANNTRKVNIYFAPQLNLKEYNDYPDDVKLLCESLVRFSQNEFSNISGMDNVTIGDNIHSIREDLTSEEVSTWAGKIVRSLNTGINSVLSSGLVEFRIVSEDEAETGKPDDTTPYVMLTCDVSTQEDLMGLPEIWIHYTKLPMQFPGYGKTHKFECFMLGIKMDFRTDFVIPQTQENFVVSATGDAGSDDIDAVQNVYSIMCDRCVNKLIAALDSAFDFNPEN